MESRQEDVFLIKKRDLDQDGNNRIGEWLHLNIA